MKNMFDLNLIVGGEEEVVLVADVTEESVEGTLPVIEKKPVLDMINPFSDPNFVPEETIVLVD